MKADRGIWRSAYSIYEGALQRLGTMEQEQLWDWFFMAAEQAQEKHNSAPLLIDLVVSIHSEIEAKIEEMKKNESSCTA